MCRVSKSRQHCFTNLSRNQVFAIKGVIVIVLSSIFVVYCTPCNRALNSLYCQAKCCLFGRSVRSGNSFLCFVTKVYFEPCQIFFRDAQMNPRAYFRGLEDSTWLSVWHTVLESLCTFADQTMVFSKQLFSERRYLSRTNYVRALEVPLILQYVIEDVKWKPFWKEHNIYDHTVALKDTKKLRATIAMKETGECKEQC